MGETHSQAPSDAHAKTAWMAWVKTGGEGIAGAHGIAQNVGQDIVNLS